MRWGSCVCVCVCVFSFFRKWNLWLSIITLTIITSTAISIIMVKSRVVRLRHWCFLCGSEVGLHLSKTVLAVLRLPTSLYLTECHMWKTVSWRTSRAISLILFLNPSICSVMFVTFNMSVMSESLRWLKTLINLQGPWFLRLVLLRWVCDNLVTLWYTT